MIPIGAPVTITYCGNPDPAIKTAYVPFPHINKSRGIVDNIVEDEFYIIHVLDYNSYFGFHKDQTKIRIDNPAPFTLWQYNSLTTFQGEQTPFSPMYAPINAYAWRSIADLGLTQ